MWYQNVRKTSGEKVMKREFEILCGRDAIVKSMGGGLPGHPPPVQLGLTGDMIQYFLFELLFLWF